MNRVTPSFHKLKEILAPMSWKGRLDYLWTYYKLVLFGVIIAIFLVSMVINGIQNAKVQTLYGGMLLGVTSTQENVEEFKTDLSALFEADGKDKIVDLVEIPYANPDDPDAAQVMEAATTKLTLMIASKTLDYILADSTAYHGLIDGDPYGDISKILSPEQLDEWQDQLIYSQVEEDAAPYPIALDISSTEFAKHIAPNEEALYLIFPGNSQHSDRHAAFLSYILEWKHNEKTSGR